MVLFLFYSQSGYACMGFYRRDNQVVEVQESGTYMKLKCRIEFTVLHKCMLKTSKKFPKLT